MARPNVRETDPVRYEKALAEQEKLRHEFGTFIKMARLCPFCEHKVETLCRGSHAAVQTKCPNCGEEIFFPPVVFRTA